MGRKQDYTPEFRAEAVMVPPRLADRLLDFWVATQEGETEHALPPHIQDLIAAVIVWLRQRKAAGWRLVPPKAVLATRVPDRRP